MPKNKVSIIIPGKDRSEFVKEALTSVVDQKLPSHTTLEIIVVDDRSKPSYKSLLQKDFPQVIFVNNNTNHHGPGPSRNVGLRQATGNYIAFLDNDDAWRSSFLATALASIKSSKAPATVCLTGPYFYGPYPTWEVIKLIFLNLVRTTVFFIIWLFNDRRLPPSGFYLCQISHMLFDVKQIKGVKFNETAVAAEDWEFMADVIKDRPLRIVPQPLVKFRYSWSSNTNSARVRAKKWNAYQTLIKKLPPSYKQGILHQLFHLYIRSFGSQ